MVVPGSENCMLCLKVIENVICFDLMCRVGGHGCGSKLYRTLRPSLFKTARDDITCSQISCIIPLPPDVQGPLHSSGPLIQLHTIFSFPLHSAPPRQEHQRFTKLPGRVPFETQETRHNAYTRVRSRVFRHVLLLITHTPTHLHTHTHIRRCVRMCACACVYE